MRTVGVVITTDAYGGPHNQAELLQPFLREAGWRQVVILPRGASPAADRLRRAGVEVVPLQLWRLRRGAQALPSLLGCAVSAWRLASVYQMLGLDLLQFAGVQNLHVAVPARMLGIPVVCQLLSTFVPPFLRAIFSPIVGYVSDVVMATGEAVLRAHPGIAARHKTVYTFYPPINVEALVALRKERQSARRGLGIPSNATCVITLGNFVPQKGHREFVTVAALLSRSYKDVYFRVVGAFVPGHEKYYYRNVIGYAKRLGLLEGARLAFVEAGSHARELLAGGDIFVITSRAEGIPTAMLEAMALGLPIVSVDVGSIAEVVAAAKSGIVVAKRRPDAVAEAVALLINNSDLRREFSENGHSFALRNLNARLCADIHIAAYNAAVSRVTDDT